MKSQLREFLKFLRFNRNASPHTVAAYDSDLSLFIAFAAKHLGVKESALELQQFELHGLDAVLRDGLVRPRGAGGRRR